MVTIKKVVAREIIDSRGNPTVEVDLFTDNGLMSRASVPSGASTGKREAVELRDGDKSRFLGQGVLKAVNNVNTEINEKVKGFNIDNQEDLDSLLIDLDGTENKGRLGANAILAVSSANLKAAALNSNLPIYQYVKEKYRKDEEYLLPVPFLNILNGGKHANNSSDFQEYKIAPVGAPSFFEAIRWSSEVFHVLKKMLHDKGLSTAVGDEGGFAPALGSNSEYVEIILEAITKAGYTPGKDIAIALDPATSSIFENNKYNLVKDNKILSSEEMISFWADWVNKYPIISLEDGLDEDDWTNWTKLTETIGHKTQIVGDDLFVTNPKIIEKGINDKVANSVLIKINQIGTISEAIKSVNLAKTVNWTSVFSHRSGETEDTLIADLVVGLGTGIIKTGSTSRSERTAKYNQIIRIEEELGSKAKYAGNNAFFNLK